MPVHHFKGLQHPRSGADRDDAGEERELKRAPGRLAAGPGMILVSQFVVLDVANRERAANQPI
jgi:hypothetical protein